MNVQIHQPTLAQHFVQVLTRNHENIAIVEGERQVTYRQLGERVGKLIGLFEARGYQPGHRVGVALPMGIDFLAIFMALQIGGYTFADMPPSMPDDALLHRVKAGAFQTVFIDPESFGGRAEGFIGALGVERFVTTPAEGCETIEQALGDVAAAPIACRPAGDFSIISFTGGSTGVPKPQGFSGASAGALALMMLASVPFPAAPVTIVYRTGYQVMQLGLIQTLMRGGKLVTLADFDLGQITARGRAHGCNVLFLATRMLYTLADQADVDWIRGQVQMIFHGGEPITPARLRSAVERFGSIFVASYGSSESGGASALLLPADHDLERPELLTSAGCPIFGVEIEVRDEQNEVCPLGEVGEIAIRSPGQMSGYIGLPEKTREAMRDGWICTGDVGRLDHDGYLHITDRTAFALTSGGTKVYPRLIDAYLSDHPAVSIAVTVGIEDPVATNLICAAVTLRPGATARPHDLLAFLALRPEAPKVDHIVVLESLPLLPANLKVNRPRLIEMVREAVTGSDTAAA